MNASISRIEAGADITIRITGSNDAAAPSGKLADAEVYFGAACGVLAGLKLIGFMVWERRSPSGRRNVTFPARTYSVNGERRSFALLRPTADVGAQDALRDAILAAYVQHEAAR